MNESPTTLDPTIPIMQLSSTFHQTTSSTPPGNEAGWSVQSQNPPNPDDIAVTSSGLFPQTLSESLVAARAADHFLD